MSIVAHRSGRQAQWMSIHEAASLVGVSPATLRRWCVAGDVSAFTTPGGHRRFSRRAISQLLPAEPAAVTRAQLERLDAVLVREIRRGASRIAATPPWSNALTDADRVELAALSRPMIAGLVASLSDTPRRRERRLSLGRAAATQCGELAGRRGVALDAMVEAGLLLHALVVHAVAEATDRLGLDGPTAARWLDVAAGCATGFLTDATRGHAAARGGPASTREPESVTATRGPGP
jgi:excisionase family DNA binding protein